MEFKPPKEKARLVELAVLIIEIILLILKSL